MTANITWTSIHSLAKDILSFFASSDNNYKTPCHFFKIARVSVETPYSINPVLGAPASHDLLAWW